MERDLLHAVLPLRLKSVNRDLHWTLSLALAVLALPVPPLYVPEIVTNTLPCTGLVVTVNVTLLLHGGIVAEAGTCATLVLLLFSKTSAPLDGARPFSVTVPVDEPPPATVLGFSVRDVNEAGFTVRVVVIVAPYAAVIVTDT